MFRALMGLSKELCKEVISTLSAAPVDLMDTKIVAPYYAVSSQVHQTAEG
jgi:hypothetical protein